MERFSVIVKAMFQKNIQGVIWVLQKMEFLKTACQQGSLGELKSADVFFIKVLFSQKIQNDREIGEIQAIDGKLFQGDLFLGPGLDSRCKKVMV